VKLKPGQEAFRVYERAATGFVSIGVVREELEERARRYCDDEGKAYKVVGHAQSNPPYILGNFPRMELVFVCNDKPTAPTDALYARLANLRRLLEDGTITRAEFEAQKRKLLVSQ